MAADVAGIVSPQAYITGLAAAASHPSHGGHARAVVMAGLWPPLSRSGVDTRSPSEQ
jgi:hypothetical protein